MEENNPRKRLTQTCPTVFDKGVKPIPRKNDLVNQWFWELLHTHMAGNGYSDLNLTPYPKNNSKWIMKLNIKTIKTFRENKTVENLLDPGLGNKYLET